MSSSPILPFEFTTGRLKCGTEEVWLQWALRWQAVARVHDPDAIVWRGDSTLRGVDQGVRILGTPLGHPDFVRSQLSALSESHDQLLEKVLTIQDLQCAWLLLLFCCGARANYTLLRVVHPELTAGFAAHHDASLRRCLSSLLGVAPASIYWDLASLPLCLGGLGLRSATLLARPAFWASWADCLEMIHQRHPTVCAHIVDALHAQHPSFHLDGVRASGEHLASAGFHAPSWQELAAGVRPEQLQDVDMEPGIPRHGWQRAATVPVHGLLIEGTVRPRLSATEKALFRSQGGPLAGIPFLCFPTSRLSRMDSSVFRVLLLRRLWLPLPPSSRFCRCGRPLDSSGHHRAACAQAGVLGRRGFALESAAARVCREAGARVSTNVLMKDLDLLPLQHADARRLEVVADGLPLYHGAQIAVDTTLVSPLRRNGTPHSRCAWEDGAALRQARRRKERVYPELSGAHGRARLVVLANEVGGRWSLETQAFLGELARAKSREEPPNFRTSAKLAWTWRWSMILACASARAFAQSLLENRAAQGFDGPTPTTAEVIGDSRYAGFA